MQKPADPSFSVPIRPRPVDGECGYGYLVRLAQANGFPTPRTFWSALKEHHNGSMPSMLAMFQLLPAEWSRLRGPLPSYCGMPMALLSGLDTDDVCHVTMRWCPQCLQVGQHLRALWSVKLVCACPEHKVLLLDQCPICSSVQRLERADIMRCVCGCRLSEAVPPGVSEDVALVQHGLGHAIRTGQPDKRFNLGANSWCGLLRLAGRAQEVGSSRRTGQVPDQHRLAVAVALSSKLGALLANWPKGLHDTLAGFQASAPQSFSISRTFGRMYRWLYVDLQDACFQFMRDAFERYLNEHWWGLVCERNRRLGKATRHTHQRRSVVGAAAAATATPAVVQQLHLAGWIDANVVSLACGRQAWSVPASEIATIAAQVSDGINLQEAATLLGLAERRVRELIDAKLIVPRLRSRGGATAWLLSRREIEGFSRRCLRQAAAGSDLTRPTIPVNQVLKAWRLESDEFPLLVVAMFLGEVSVASGVSDHVIFGELSLVLDSVRAWRDARHMQYRERLSIDAASRLLGVKQEVGYQLVRAGLLASVADASKQKRRFVPREAVTEFIERYVSLAELARVGQQSPRTLIRRIEALPVCGPGIDGVRQYFFLKADVARPSQSHV